MMDRDTEAEEEWEATHEAALESGDVDVAAEAAKLLDGATRPNVELAMWHLQAATAYVEVAEKQTKLGPVGRLMRASLHQERSAAAAACGNSRLAAKESERALHRYAEEEKEHSRVEGEDEVRGG